MKKYLALMLAALLLLTGCSAGEAPAQDAEENTLTLVASIRSLFPLSVNASVSGISAVENTFIVAGETEDELRIALTAFSSGDGGVDFSDSVTCIYKGLDHIYGITEGEGCFYLLAGNMEETYTEESARLTVLTVSFAGEIVRETPLDTGLSVQPRGFCVSGGSFIVAGNNFLNFYDTDGGFKSVVKTDFEIFAFQPTGSGAFVQLNRDGRFPVYRLDGAGKLEAIDWDEDWLSSSRQDILGRVIYGYDIFTEYDPDTGETRELFSWLELTGDIYRYDNLCRIAEDTYLYSDGGIVYLLTTEYRIDLRTPVKVAFMGDYSQTNAVKFAARFNMVNSEYRAEARMYEKQELELAISVGDCPDIIFYGMDNLDTTTNQFMDLRPLIEQSSVISEDTLLPGLLDSLAAGGELHELWYALAIYFWVGQAGYIDRDADKAWDDYCARAQELGDLYTVVDQDLNKNVLLRDFLMCEIHNYVDMENWVCTFDSPSFARLLSICKETGIDYSPLYDSDDRGAEYEAYMASYVERLPLVTLRVMSGCRTQFWEGTCLISSPFSPVMASCAETPCGSKLCIPARCGNVDGAFALMEYVMSPDTQKEFCSGKISIFGVPTNVEALEYCTESVMTPESVKQLRSILDSRPQLINAVKERMIAMVKESAQAYFCGDKTLEETIAIIQNRASIYLSEKAPLAKG